jgi:ANTAR domain
MDLTRAITEFVDEMVNIGSVGRTGDTQQIDQMADAVAMVRLRLRIVEAYLNDGWLAPPELLEQIKRDRELLRAVESFSAESVSASVAEDMAVIRARAVRVRRDAQLARVQSADARAFSVETRLSALELRGAIADRAMVERAKGMVMERRGLDANDALLWMLDEAEVERCELRQFAFNLVESMEG